MLRTTIVTLLVLLGAQASPASSAGEQVDLLVVNARVWTGDTAAADATWFTVLDGVFVQVGKGEAPHVDATRTIDAHGRRILPGLIDAHVHLTGAAADLARLNLRGATSREDLLNRVAQHAATMEAGAWVIGRGWSAESWPMQLPPDADEIEKASQGRPSALIRMDGHSLLASRSALEAAHIDKNGPPDPPGGKIGRDETGAPTGAIYEQAMSLLLRAAPKVNDTPSRSLLVRAVRHANQLGLTQIGAIESRRSVEEALAPLDRDDGLTLRCQVSITEDIDSVQGWRAILDWATQSRSPSEHVRIIGIKGYMDGSLGSRTAWQTAPYLDDPQRSDNAGMPLAMAASGELRELILLASSRGLQPAVHAIGDRANHTLLNWYSQIPRRQRLAVRPSIEHAQHLLPGDIARFAELGVVASMQPLHKADDGRYATQRLGPARIRTSYAYRSLLDSGARLAFGSDWPVVSVNPFLGIYAAVSGKTTEGEPFLPEESISVEEAIRAYTVDAAWRLHSENRTGSIRPGFDADFIMLDRDPLRIDISEIPGARVLLTVFAGRIVIDARTP